MYAYTCLWLVGWLVDEEAHDIRTRRDAHGIGRCCVRLRYAEIHSRYVLVACFIYMSSNRPLALGTASAAL